MKDTMKKTVYKAFGLNIISEIPLPELPEINVPGEIAEVIIEQYDLKIAWSENSIPNEYFVIKENLCMFRVPDLAIFLIQEGRKIIVSPVKDSCKDQIRLYILGTCMGALLIQRKILPLHGSAVAIDGKAYAIVGDSGAGKSTLATALLSRGYQLLSDDLIPVSLSEENIPMVVPAYPQQKLWLESLNQFCMESSQYRPIFDRETKFAIPVSSQFGSEPLPLAGIFELVKNDQNVIELRSFQKLERLQKLYTHTYRNFLLPNMGLVDWHFNTSAKMIKKIDFYQLRRPTDRFTALDLSDLIVNMLKMEEIVHD